MNPLTKYLAYQIIPSFAASVKASQGRKTADLSKNFDLWYKKVNELGGLNYSVQKIEFKKIIFEHSLGAAIDPLDEEYFVFQKKIHSILTKESICYKNEETPFDFDLALTHPFPYDTKNPKVIGEHLQAISWYLQNISEQPGSKILEFGPGWGNLTLMLANAGYNMTALDINKNFLRLISERAKKINAKIDTVCGDFMDCKDVSDQYDAIIFFESFHHCFRFDKLIRELHRILKPGGTLYFFAEPISFALNKPWGIRLDGESAFVARKYGWIELGFNHWFFLDFLRKNGFQNIKFLKLKNNPWGSIFKASK